VQASTDIGNSVAAHFKFKKKTWTKTTFDWNAAFTSMVGIYLGLEYGPSNTMALVGLTDNGTTPFVTLSGPLQTFSVNRPLSYSTALAWPALTTDQLIEMFIIFNSSTKNVELWVGLNNAALTLVTTQAISSLGTYPNTKTALSGPTRPGPSTNCTMFFGIPGAASDVLELVDWALYPDYRRPLISGAEAPNSTVHILPDSPITYAASSNILPEKQEPSRWYTSGTFTSSLIYQPGNRKKAIYSSITKSTLGRAYYQRNEPRIQTQIDGCMVEGFISGKVSSLDSETTGMGLAIDDGSKFYSAIMLNSLNNRLTYGMLSDNTNISNFSSYYTPSSDYDFRSLKLVRLIVDRSRNKVLLFVDNQGTPVSSISMASTFPASVFAGGKVLVGHVLQSTGTGSLNIHTLNYWPRYKGWEGIDNLLPDDVGIGNTIRFSPTISGGGSSSMVGSSYVNISSNSVGGIAKYFKGEPLTIDSGITVDFKTSITAYTNSVGTRFSKNTQLSAMLNIYLASRRMQFGFFDCGVHGRKVAILPSGGASEILNQTSLGRLYSADCDWTQAQDYRITVKAFEGIKVWVGSTVVSPVISIPWNGDYDLPVDSSSSGIEFGHTNTSGSSTSKWYYMRWGTSNGMDLSVVSSYPNGYKSYLFGGRIYSLVSFAES
jgi:hypothetical protein